MVEAMLGASGSRGLAGIRPQPEEGHSQEVSLRIPRSTAWLEGKRATSYQKLLDRVIQHAELIYRVSEENCAIFEEMFIPFEMRSQHIQGINTCITQTFPTPGSKSEIQQISRLTITSPFRTAASGLPLGTVPAPALLPHIMDKWLLHSVLMLVQSWIEPLVYLQTTLDRYEDAPNTLLNKTKWVSDKLLSLEQGVVVLIRKMLDEGMLVSSGNEQSLVNYSTAPEMLESVLRDYTLLTCFKKDAHKMETYLKLLKCPASHPKAKL
ncbi:hypothetical protein JZ751_002012 [Albula glossodonta]|uniref:Somatolactin n=1 Tax=Albula glossodonta TaxID=121402 RepID=A0A8T2PHJ8_9TELE|nr:hypothetical protein JZ751_002012 [Albula glossodonta]